MRPTRQNLICVLLALLQSSMAAQTVDTAKEIYDSTNASVFLLYLNDSSGKPTAFGSGFLIAPRTIATNAHVIKGGSTVVAFGPVRIPARVVKVDSMNDSQSLWSMLI